MISESRVPENGMPGLMSGDWKRSTVSGPQRLQLTAWTAPDLSATAPALDSTPLPLIRDQQAPVGCCSSRGAPKVLVGEAADLEQGGYALGSDRLGEKIALTMITAELTKLRVLLDGFDPLGGNAQLQSPCQGHDPLHDRGVL